jgi:hypothetical protein
MIVCQPTGLVTILMVQLSDNFNRDCMVRHRSHDANINSIIDITINLVQNNYNYNDNNNTTRKTVAATDATIQTTLTKPTEMID